MSRWTISVAVIMCMGATSLVAQEQVTQAKAYFTLNGERIKISRGNREAAPYALQLAAYGGGCGAPCIAPLQVAESVHRLDEALVMEFLMTEVAAKNGLMGNARMPEDPVISPASLRSTASCCPPPTAFRLASA